MRTKNTQKLPRRKLLIFGVLVFLATLLVPLIHPAPVYALNNDKLSQAEQEKRTQVYAIARCFELSGGLNTIVPGSYLNEQRIWDTGKDGDGSSNSIPIGYEIDPENGVRECQNLDYDALSFVDMSWDSFWKKAYGEKQDGDGRYHLQPGAAQYLHQTILDRLKDKQENRGKKEVIGPKEKERRILLGLSKCIRTTPAGKAASGLKVSKPGYEKYEFRSGQSASSVIPMGQDFTFYAEDDDGTYTCDTLINLGKDAIGKLGDKTLESVTGDIADDAAGGGAAGEGDEAQIGCEFNVNPLSWIICPTISIMGAVTGEMNKLISQQMVLPADDIFCLNSNGNGNKKTCDAYYLAWSSFRNIALGLLAIAGLIIIIAQAVGMEILDAYTIRKMLPRILVAAIAITLSWPLMNFAVTLSNNLGFAVRDLITAPFSGLDNTVSLSGDIGAVLAGGGAALVAGVAAVAALGILFSYIGTALLAVLIAVLVLVVRQIVVIAFIIISPIAIIAYVLPNTERIFRIWWESFSKALLMFPLIVAFIATGRVFAAVTLSNSQSLLAQITAFVAYFGPYFAIPLTFSMSGRIMGAAGNAINQRGQPAFGRLSQYRKDRGAAKLKNARAGQLFDKEFGRFGKKGRTVGGLANTFAAYVSDPDEIIPWQAGKEREIFGKKRKGLWGTRRRSKDLQFQLDNRAINESTKSLEDFPDMHYEAWRGIAGRGEDYQGMTTMRRDDGSQISVADALAAEGMGPGFVPSSEDDFTKMGKILQMSDNDKERLGGTQIEGNAGGLASVKHRPDMEYADTQIMAGVALAAAGRSDKPDGTSSLDAIANSIEKRTNRGVGQKFMSTAQKAASRTERPDLREGHGMIRSKENGEWESVFSKKNRGSKTAHSNVLSIKGSAWSGAKAEAVDAAGWTIASIAKGEKASDATEPPSDAERESMRQAIEYGVRNFYSDPGQQAAWRKVAEDAGMQEILEKPRMTEAESKEKGRELDLMELQHLSEGAGAGAVGMDGPDGP